MRFVPAMPLEADGIGAYVAFTKLKEMGKRWPTGWAIQLLNIRPKCVNLYAPMSMTEVLTLVTAR